MKIILAVGAPGSGHESVFSALTAAGVSPALPSRREQHSPQDLSRLLLAAVEVDASSQTPTEQLRPGRTWEELATDLMLANLEQPAWGWADHRLAWLMDFWRDFDPQVRLLLVYSSAPEFLAGRLSQKRPVGRPLFEAALREWTDWNTALLRYQLRNPERCLLVNAQAALAKSQELVKLVRESWRLAGLKAPANGAPEAESDVLLAQAARALVPPGHPARSLEQQLHNAAQLPGVDGADAVTAGLASWNVAAAFVADQQARATQLQTENAAARQQTEKLQEALKAAQRSLQQHAVAARQENERLQTLVDETKRELEQQAGIRRAYEQQVEQLTAARDEAVAELARHAASPASEELQRDNQLLQLQLQQVQEELERYFRRCQELSQAREHFVTDFWRTHQPETVTIDMRRPIVGEQWHAAEVDGRWSGPSALSTVDLPPLQPGSYTLEMDVIDAVAPDVLTGAQVELEGQQHPLAIEYLGDGEAALPAVCSTHFRINGNGGDSPLRLSVRLPRTASPAIPGVNDDRQLGVRVQQLRILREAADQ